MKFATLIALLGATSAIRFTDDFFPTEDKEVFQKKVAELSE